jgi:hypothetical protein
MYEYDTENRGLYASDPLGVGDKQRLASVLRFDLPFIPPEATITSATLELYAVGWSSPNAILTIGCYAITRTTSLNELTWTLAQAGNPWGTPGCNDPFTDCRAKPESSQRATEIGRWYTFSVASLVQGWVDGSVPNNGLLLRSNLDPLTAHIFFFASAEHFDPAQRPRLAVTYRFDDLPVPSQTSTATPTATASVTRTPTTGPGAEHTITIQQGTYLGSEDTYLYKYAPTANYCLSDTLMAGFRQQYVSLLRFDVSGVPRDATVTRASLQVYATGWSGQDGTIGTYVISRTVSLCDSNWYQARAGDPWGAEGCSDTDSDRSGLLSSTARTSGVSRWYGFDVTRAVQSWVGETRPNNGVLLSTTYASFTGTFRFASAQHSDVGLRPKLVVSYVVGLPTPTPRAEPYLIIGHITDDHVGRNVVCSSLLQDFAGLISQQADVLVDTGDCTENGTEEETIEYRDHMRGNMTIPWMAVPGNHDTPDVFQWHIGPLNWWWDVGGYRLIGIDSEAINRDPYDPRAMNALDAALTTDRPCIVFGHFPLDSEGYSEETNRKLRQRFSAYRVLLYVSGHWHVDSFTTDPTTGTKLLVGHWTCGNHYRLIRLQGTRVEVEQKTLSGTNLGECGVSMEGQYPSWIERIGNAVLETDLA